MTNAVLSMAAAGLRGRRKAGLIAIFAVLVLAALGISCGLVVSRQGAPLLDRVAAQADVAHLVVYGDHDALASLARDPEVRAGAGPFTTVNADLVQGDGTIAMMVTALDEPTVEVGRPAQRRGRWVAAADEIVLDRSLAADLGIGIGDAVQLRADDPASNFTVVGTAVNLTDCFYPQCDPGHAWTTTAGLDRLGAAGERFDQLWLRFESADEAGPFLQRQAEAGTQGIGGTDSWVDTRKDFLTLDRVFGAFVTAFGIFVLVAGAVVVAGTMAARLVQRRREIGLLGAVGFTPRQVSTALLLEHLALGVAAAVVGWCIAGFLAPSLQLGIGAALGTQQPTWTVLGLVVTTVIIAVVLTLATIVPARRAARQPVIEVLRDEPGDRSGWLTRRVAGVPRRLPTLGIRDILCRPGRSALTALAITIAVIGATVTAGFIGGIDVVRGDPARTGSPYDVTVDLQSPSPSFEAALGADPNVATWYSEQWRRSTLNDGAFMAVATGGNPDDARFRLGGGRNMRAPSEGIAGYGFLQRFGLSVGDEVRFLAGTTPLTVRIVGWYRETEDSGEILRYRFETLAGAEPHAMPYTYRITAAHGLQPNALAADLQRQAPAGAQVEPIGEANGDLNTFTFALRLVAFILIAMAAANLLTSMLTSTRESARRVGIAQTVGFTPRQLIVQGAISGAALGCAAVLCGVPFGLWLFRVLSDLVGQAIGIGPGWMPMPGAIELGVLAVVALVLSAGLGALAVAQLARRPAAQLVRWE